MDRSIVAMRTRHRRYCHYVKRRLSVGSKFIPDRQATAQVCAGEDGVIIICAYADGMGGTYFTELMTSGTPGRNRRKIVQKSRQKKRFPNNGTCKFITEV